MNARIVRIACAFALLGCAPPARAQSSLNLDFEDRADDAKEPDGWSGRGYEVVLGDADAKSGKAALRMVGKGVAGQFGVATRSLPVGLARGKKVRLSGEIKTADIGSGYAGLWLRVDGPDGKMLGFDNMAVRAGKDGRMAPDDRSVRGSAPWARHAIEVEVDPAATAVYFGCLHSGDGTAWFDALAVEVDGKPYDRAWQEAQAGLGPNPEQVAWLKGHAIPVATEVAGRGFDDLQPLKAAIGDARIVSLGEATHGTAEFFRMKHRLVEFLASEMGFTVFAIEASMPEAFRLNDYVLRGQGDPEELLRGMYFWTWDTREVLDMILWMRAFNASGKGRIEFLGFDMQEPKVAAENVRAFVAKADPGFSKALDEAYAGLKSYRELAPAWARDDGEGPGVLGGVVTRVRAAALGVQAGAVLKHLEAGRDRLIQGAGGDAPAVDWAIQNARVVAQAVGLLAGGSDHRDRCMADNVDWILGHRPAGTKVVLWAHNGHVHKHKGAMGGFLADRHGREMVVVGFAFHEGRYTAVARGSGLRANDAGPSEPGSVEWGFHRAGLPRAILDLREVEKSSLGSGWLAEPIGHRNIGAVAMRSAFASYDLPASYDLLVFFDQTTPSVPVRPRLDK